MEVMTRRCASDPQSLRYCPSRGLRQSSEDSGHFQVRKRDQERVAFLRDREVLPVFVWRVLDLEPQRLGPPLLSPCRQSVQETQGTIHGSLASPLELTRFLAALRATRIWQDEAPAEAERHNVLVRQGDRWSAVDASAHWGICARG